LSPAISRPAFIFQAVLVFVFVITFHATAEKRAGTKSDAAKSVGEIILGTDPVGMSMFTPLSLGTTGRGGDFWVIYPRMSVIQRWSKIEVPCLA